MSEMPYHVRDFRRADFKLHLERFGGIVLDPTNEWEVIRYRTRGGAKGVHVVYRNKKNGLKFSDRCAEHYHKFLKGHDPFVGARGEASTDALSFAHSDYGTIRLYTDASSYHATKAGAWGAVLDDDGALEEASGPLKGDVSSSTSAEARAVANALHHFIKAGCIKPGSCVQVILDNIAVVRRINDKRGSKTLEVNEALLAIRGYELRLNLDLSALWVKGHQKGGDVHAQRNRRCDELAGQHSIVVHLDRKAGATDAHP